MLVEKSIFPVLMSTIEQPITIYDVIPEAFGFVIEVGVLLILQIIFV